MRYINLYLIGYAVFLLGIILALWKTNILQRIDPVWIGIGFVIAIGVGIMISVSSAKPTVTTD